MSYQHKFSWFKTQSRNSQKNCTLQKYPILRYSVVTHNVHANLIGIFIINFVLIKVITFFLYSISRLVSLVTRLLVIPLVCPVMDLTTPLRTTSPLLQCHQWLSAVLWTYTYRASEWVGLCAWYSVCIRSRYVTCTLTCANPWSTNIQSKWVGGPLCLI